MSKRPLTYEEERALVDQRALDHLRDLYVKGSISLRYLEEQVSSVLERPDPPFRRDS